ncbi:MAG: integrase arm-type DNA-binding domain-containing protein [Alphaproteobacteria bacterium]|nr:integrase arm-type DNA-binding domain-containing protein [Alphaproteobacteria bacterium]
MPTRKLTDLFVENVKPPSRARVEYFDASFPGLALRVTDKGGKSWCVFYRFHGRLRRFTIGTFPALKPAQARREAGAALDKVRDGIDPAEEKRARRDERTPEMQTFGAVARDYLELHHKRNSRESTFSEATRDFEKHSIAAWDQRPIASITRRDVIALIDRIVQRGAQVQANRTLARLRAMFNWAIAKDRLAVSPAAGIELPTQEQTRDRVLSDDELRWLWHACDEIGWPFGPFAKLLLLTAQRRDEVRRMERAEIDVMSRVWTIPGPRAKNGRLHEVQLSQEAVDVLRSLQKIGDRFAFTTDGEKPIAGFSNAKRRLDVAMLKARRKSLGLPVENEAYRKSIGIAAGTAMPVEIPHWTFHDLRRTAATGMARMNFPPHVVDKILNHASGTIRGVAAVYNRFEYREERRAALAAWDRYVLALASDVPENVVPLHGTRASL